MDHNRYHVVPHPVRIVSIFPILIHFNTASGVTEQSDATSPVVYNLFSIIVITLFLLLDNKIFIVIMDNMDIIILKYIL